MKKGNGGGCIVGILAFCFLGGNVFLFNGLNDLSDNGFAIIMVLLAICGDIFLVGFIIKAIIGAIVKKKDVNTISQPGTESTCDSTKQSAPRRDDGVNLNESNVSVNYKSKMNNTSLRTETTVQPVTNTIAEHSPKITDNSKTASNETPKLHNNELDAFAKTIRKVMAMHSIAHEEKLVYPRGFYSRDEYEDRRLAERAYLFKKEALLLKDAKDDYYERFGQYAYTPNFAASYDELNENDLRRYLSWRNDYRSGSKKIDVRYIRLYLSELINGVHYYESSDQLLHELVDYLSIICKEEELLGQQNSLFLQDLSKWTLEFYVLVFPTYPADKFNKLLPEKIKFPANKSICVTSKDYSKYKDLINQISSYKFLSNDFYKAGNGKLLLEAIDYVFNKLEEFLQPKGVEWTKTVYFSFGYNKEDWFPANLLYYFDSSVDDREVILTSGDKYAIIDGKGYAFHNRDNYHTAARHPYRRLLGYTIKLIENELRKNINYKYGLLPEKRNFSLEQYYLLKNEALFDVNFSQEYCKTINVCSTDKFREFVVHNTKQYYRLAVQNKKQTTNATKTDPSKKKKQKSGIVTKSELVSTTPLSKSSVEWGSVEIPATVVSDNHAERITTLRKAETNNASKNTEKDSSAELSTSLSPKPITKQEFNPQEIVMDARPSPVYKSEIIAIKDTTIIGYYRAMNSIPFPTKDNLLYPKRFYSRQEVVDEDKARKAQHFYHQAVYMADVEDDFKKKITPYISIVPSYEYLSIDQKRCYFTWRTQYRKGIIEKTSACFVAILLCELINNIPNTPDKKTRFEVFLDYVTNIRKYLVEDTWYFSSFRIGQWIRDYYILNDLPFSSIEFNDSLPEEYRLTPISTFKTPISRVYSDSKELLNHNSSYKYLSSIFYKSEYGYLLDEAIDVIFPDIEEYLKKYKISWFDSIFSTVENLQEQRVDWFPFEGLTYYPGPTVENTDITLVNGERYCIKNGKGYRWYSYLRLNPYEDAIAYTIKLIENELRKALGFRYKLQPNPNMVSSNLNYYQDLRRKYEKKLEVFCTNEYADMVVSKTVEFFDTKNIERLVMSLTYQRKKELEKKRAEKARAAQVAKQNKQEKPTETPVVINIDRSKFDSIRRVSEELQSALIVEEDSASEKALAYAADGFLPLQEDIASVDVENEAADNEYSMLIRSLTKLETTVLSIVLYANPQSLSQLNQIVVSNNDLLEAVIDRINEKALEIIEDNIIEFSETPIVYEDYSDELKSVLQEERL